jgi:hypothetical protein
MEQVPAISSGTRPTMPLATSIRRGRLIVESRYPSAKVAVVPLSTFSAGHLDNDLTDDGYRSFTWRHADASITLGHGDDHDGVVLALAIVGAAGRGSSLARSGLAVGALALVAVIGTGLLWPAVPSAIAMRMAEVAPVAAACPPAAGGLAADDLSATMHRRVQTGLAATAAMPPLAAGTGPAGAPAPEAMKKLLDEFKTKVGPQLTATGGAANTPTAVGTVPVGTGADQAVFVPLQ